jgi:hypothetical protein
MHRIVFSRPSAASSTAISDEKAADFLQKGHTSMNRFLCQIFTLHEFTEPLAFYEKALQRAGKLKMALRRRHRYLINTLTGFFREKETSHDIRRFLARNGSLQPGDRVRVRSRAEIQATLNNWNQLHGCAFLDEMWDYCGTVQQVKKRVSCFLSEDDYYLRHCKGIVLLKDVCCQGTRDIGPCDRSCHYFWKEAWLEKLPAPRFAEALRRTEEPADFIVDNR